MQRSETNSLRGEAAEFTRLDPKGHGGEFGIETDTGKVKVFDGDTKWSDLAYANLSPVDAADISDATATGIALVTAVDAAAARTAIGAGTGSSNFALVAAPASATAAGTAGQIATDTGFIYVCTATNTWKRVAIATW